MEALTGGYGVNTVWAMGHVSDHSLILVDIHRARRGPACLTGKPAAVRDAFGCSIDMIR